MREEGISSSGDPLVSPNSPPHTAAASSAGASSPAVAINAGSTDWLGQGQTHGSKAGSLSRISSQPVWISLSTSACGSALGSSQPSCRPWERADLLRRLSTFRPANWVGKPKAASSLACARRGWVNVDVDKIQCESCGASLKYNSSVSWIPTKGENNGDEFANQLDEGHNATCPWRGNSCAESLVQFPPTPPSALVGGYKDRCDGLLQFNYLPRVANSVVDQMKLSRSQEVDRFLIKSTAFLPDVVTPDFEICLYLRAQKLISLCGWEPRWLPNVQDCEENSAQSARNGASFSPIKDPCGPASKSESRSPLLDCSLCGSTVSIMDFIHVNRPPHFAPNNTDVPETSKKTVITRGVSAASGIGGWAVADGGIDEAATTGHKRPVSELYQDGNIGLGQPAGSGVGDRAASYESRGPKRNRDEGGSTVDRPHGSVRQTDSVEGDVIDHEGDEVNDSQPGPSQTVYFKPYEQSQQTATIARNSSVIAIDTVFNEDDDTDSMESVENHPGFIDDVSIKSPDLNENENDTSDLNLNLDHSIQAQESRVRVTGQLGGISSTNDEEVLTRTETGRGRDPGGAVSGGSVGMGASHEGEIHGSGGLMIQRAGSVVGDMEPVTGLTGQTETETGQQECSGRGDSGSKVVGSVKGESVTDLNLLPNEQSSHPSVSCNAVVCSGFELSKDEVMQDVKSSPTANGLGPPNGESNFEEAMEFDPIKHHNYFCPWVNGNVAAAGVINSKNGASSSDSGQSQTLCGWQLTLDALDGFQDPQQNQTVESESAASLYKDDHQGSGKKLMARHSFNRRRGQN